MQFCSAPTRGFTVESVNHLCITMTRVFAAAALSMVVKNKKSGFTLRESLLQNIYCILRMVNRHWEPGRREGGLSC